MVSYAITGASRGLGLEFIRQLSKEPTNVVFAIVRNTTSSPELSDLAAKNSNVHIVLGDITSLSQIQEAAKVVSSITGGSLDVLVNNAAYLSESTAALQPSELSSPENLELVKESIQKSVESNVLGAIYVTNSFLPLIEQGTAKKVVHISTGMADTDLILGAGVAGSIPYSASKAMMNCVVAKYSVELKAKDIHVVAMSPGWVETNPMPQEALEWMTAMFKKVDPRVTGRIQKEDSVRDQLETISNLGWAVQGTMISQHGNRD
ncbi:putative short-chain dehydrogenase, partial [Amniculicola lignicola CBS 123094]